MTRPVYTKTDQTRLAGLERRVTFLERRPQTPEPDIYSEGGGGGGLVTGWMWATPGTITSLGGSDYGPDWGDAAITTAGDITGVDISTPGELVVPDGWFLCWYAGYANETGWPILGGGPGEVRLLNTQSLGTYPDGVGPVTGGNARFVEGSATLTMRWKYSGDPPGDFALASLLVVRFAES